MNTHTKKMLSYLAIGLLLSQSFALMSSSFDGTGDTSTEVQATESIETEVVENKEAPASENEDTPSVENTETEPTQDTENQETTTMNVVAQASNTMDVLIISDEAVLAEQIISDEAVLEEIPAEEVEELEEVIDPVVVSEKAEALSYNISDQKLLLMFTKNKSRFLKISNGGYDYNDFENAWKELSYDYNNKSAAKKMNQKKVFIEIYLQLSNEL